MIDPVHGPGVGVGGAVFWGVLDMTRSNNMPTIGVNRRLTNNIPQNPNLQFLPIKAISTLTINMIIRRFIKNSAGYFVDRIVLSSRPIISRNDSIVVGDASGA